MLQLVTLTEAYRPQLIDLMEEWLQSGEPIYPYSIGRLPYEPFDAYLHGFEEEQKGLPGWVPGTTLFCLDPQQNLFVGAVNIRHQLNDFLLNHGGHIGHGIRPSQRRRGYATRMVALALETCKALSIPSVLMVCDKANTGSVKSIVKNGGVLASEEVINGETEQRYWIHLT